MINLAVLSSAIRAGLPHAPVDRWGFASMVGRVIMASPADNEADARAYVAQCNRLTNGSALNMVVHWTQWNDMRIELT